MKGEQAEYTIGLRNAFMFPPKKRIRKALNVINRFVKKHTRAKETNISNEVNEELHKNSKNIPRRVNVVLLKENDKVTVFLQNGKQLKAYLEQKAKDKKKKETEKKPKEDKKETKKEAEEDQEKKEKLEEKKAKETVAKAIEMKRK
ncbi:MAG: 60S ribosomal protein L31 [archaeon]|nr:60S ribosomal protein L31 [archaeon]